MEIGIAEALAQINQPETGPFSIKFVRVVDGKNGQRGTAKLVKRAVRYITGSNTSGSDGKSQPHLKDRRMLRLKDLQAGHPFDLNIATILEYNGQTVRH